MAKAKKNTYIEEDLEWLEIKATEIREFADANPYHKLIDRIESLNSPKGATEKVIATVEAQQKSIREALKDYALIIEAIGRLRQLEEEKDKKVRGNEALTPMESGQL